MKWVVGLFARGGITYLRATIRAGRALNVGRGTATIRNHSCEDTGRTKEVTDFCGHDTRNESLVESKGCQTGKGANFRRDGTSKVIVVQLEKFHGSEHTNIVDATRQLVVVHVCVVEKSNLVRMER